MPNHLLYHMIFQFKKPTNKITTHRMTNRHAYMMGFNSLGQPISVFKIHGSITARERINPQIACPWRDVYLRHIPLYI